jgi:hypothetical protein
MRDTAAALAALIIGIVLGLALFPVLVAPEDEPSLAGPSPSYVVDKLPPLVEVAAASSAPEPITISTLRIALPRLGIDLPLELGDVVRDVPRPGYAGGTPENVALIFPSTRLPGEGGNTYIYAHARAGMFLSLWSARVGDEVDIYRQDGSLRRVYRVAVILPRVDPSDTQWLDADGIERLTLQTSTGPVPGNPRFIVVAYPESSSSEASAHP